MTDSLKHIVGKSDSIGITDAEVTKIAGAGWLLRSFQNSGRSIDEVPLCIRSRAHLQQETPDE